MAFVANTYENILAGILRDIRSLQPQADIGSDSDNYVRAAAFAAATEGLYQKLAWLYRQIFPDTADEEELLHVAALRKVLRKEAVAATGTVRLSGVAGVELLQGASLKHIASGAVFNLLDSVRMGSDGTATVAVKAAVAGAALNALSGPLSVTSPPLGLDAAAAFVQPTEGGEDQESIDSVLARYLDILQKPPAGGADYDFERWAKEVPGVAGAIALPRRRGAGTVDVVITASNGAPSPEVTAACQAAIEAQCSVIADVQVFVPALRVVNCSARVELDSDYHLEDVQVAAQAAYEALLGALQPMEPLKRSQLEAMVSNLAGIKDRSVLTPTGNVAAADDPELIGWIRPGTITLELMP
ncbi:baseplate J/gp47 family protein [Pseudomonas sp. GV071]|uniref:baseplate J/gp47 family protein n=1 Tax=Pseudomonas sp. GV071 TaxID=2135754 RepID=UPI000D3839DE|nr:baseplate J/gp47 family protein [Pseudomonas sp. GV071]PTQ68134.1 putative phage protein gp47/JayE [Pseudomonas sp. GV071]